MISGSVPRFPDKFSEYFTEYLLMRLPWKESHNWLVWSQFLDIYGNVWRLSLLMFFCFCFLFCSFTKQAMCSELSGDVRRCLEIVTVDFTRSLISRQWVRNFWKMFGDSRYWFCWFYSFSNDEAMGSELFGDVRRLSLLIFFYFTRSQAGDGFGTFRRCSEFRTR